MNTQEITNRTDSIKVRLDNMNNEIAARCQNLEPQDYMDLVKYRAEILSSKNAFDSKKYFVVCLGAAKAGKSTLLNALAEREVSHASPSAETTLHCSIIMVADELHPEGITLYSLRNNNSVTGTAQDPDIEEHTQLLLEYFKGTKSWDDINKTFSRSMRTYSLTGTEASQSRMTNLEYILTSHTLEKIQPDDNFFLAEIRVNVTNPENILNHDVALIDMPGLDGITAGKDKNPILECLPKYCHQFLLVQSSVTALNSVTQNVLQEIVALKPSAPLWVVYNEIRGKAEWHKREALDAAREEEIKRAKQELERLTKGMQNGIKTFNVNAVMAWESCETEHAKHLSDFKPGMTPEVLREHSRIETLMLALCEQVTTQKQTTILGAALDDCIKLNRPFQNDGKSAIRLQELQAEITELEKQNQNWTDCLKAMKSVCQNYRSDNLSDLVSSLSDDFRKILKTRKDTNTPSILDNLKKLSVDFQFPASKGKNGSYSPKEQKELIDKYLAAFSQEVYQVLSETPFADMARRKLKGYVEKDPDDPEIVHKGKLDYFTDSLLAANTKLPQENADLLGNAVKNYLANLSFNEITKGNFEYTTIEEYFNAKGDKYNVPTKTIAERFMPSFLYDSLCQNTMNDYFQGMKKEYTSYLEKELQGDICVNFANHVAQKYLDGLASLPTELDKVYQQWQKKAYTTRHQYCEKLENLLVDLKDATADLKLECERFKYDQENA